jgi:hypothetical protein
MQIARQHRRIWESGEDQNWIIKPLGCSTNDLATSVSRWANIRFQKLSARQKDFGLVLMGRTINYYDPYDRVTFIF